MRANGWRRRPVRLAPWAFSLGVGIATGALGLLALRLFGKPDPPFLAAAMVLVSRLLGEVFHRLPLGRATPRQRNLLDTLVALRQATLRLASAAEELGVGAHGVTNKVTAQLAELDLVIAEIRGDWPRA